MFPFREAFIVFTIATFIWENYLEYRQYKQYNADLPEELRGLVEQEKYKKSKEYGREKLLFGVFVSFFDLIHNLLVLMFFGLPWLWNLSLHLMQYFGYDAEYDNIRAFVFCYLGLIYSTLLHIPFSLYSNFVIEEKYGFNKQTLFLYFTDLIKTIVLSLVFGIPILYGVLYMIKQGGEYFWFYLWLFLFVVILIMMTIFPTFIAPLFNKYSELEEGELKNAIYALAREQKFPLTKLYEVDGSRRSNHSNAYMYGFFHNKRIVLYDTLKQQVDTKGIVAILAHELGHWKFSHTLKQLFISELYLGIFCFLFGKIIYNDDMFESFGFHNERSVFIGLLLFNYIYGPVDHIFSLFSNFLSRTYEYQADEFAVKLGHDLTDPLIKIHVENLGNLNPDSLYSTYHYTHPTLVERLRAMKIVTTKVK